MIFQFNFRSKLNQEQRSIDYFPHTFGTLSEDFIKSSKSDRENMRLKDYFNIKKNNVTDKNIVSQNKKRLCFELAKIYLLSNKIIDIGGTSSGYNSLVRLAIKHRTDEI